MPDPTPHVPTLLTRAKVEGFCCAGFTQDQIANYLRISDDTLRKYYRDELDMALMNKTLALSNNLYADALNGDKDDRQFWLKCQAGWHYARAPEDKDKDKVAGALMEKLIDKL